MSRESNIGMVAPARAIRRLVAALRRAAIHDHGPIEADKISSAVKRIVGGLKNVRGADGAHEP